VRALAVLALLAACGGGKSATPAPKDPEPTAAEKEPPLTHEQHVAELEDIATRGCACADAACIRTVDADLAELIREVPVPTDADMTDADATAGIEALGRYLECMTKLGAEPDLSYHDAFAKRMEDIGDASCACRDITCANFAWGGLAIELIAIAGRVQDDRKAYASIDLQWKRIEGCVAPINAKLSDQAIVELTELRAAACACTAVACADAVQADFDAFLERHKDTKGSEEAAETIGKLAGEMAACLDTARGEPPAE